MDLLGFSGNRQNKKSAWMKRKKVEYKT